MYQRDNGEFGVSHTWPIKFNEKFQKDFTCLTNIEETDPSVFSSQALFEFQQCVLRLFGPQAIERAPIIFASNKRKNPFKVIVGLPQDIDHFLRRHPELCDEMKIAKLHPGGFVCVYKNGKGRTGPKHFEYQPNVQNVLYVKKGWEEMACVKPLSLFLQECQFGPEVTEQYYPKPDEPPSETPRSHRMAPVVSPRRLPEPPAPLVA